MANFISGTWHFIYCLWKAPMRGFNSTQTLQHWFMNITTAAVSNRNSSWPGKPQAIFPSLSAAKETGTLSFEQWCCVTKCWSSVTWTQVNPQISPGGFQHLSITQCLNQHWHTALQLLAGESQMLLPQNLSSAIWSLHTAPTKLLHTEYDFKLCRIWA